MLKVEYGTCHNWERFTSVKQPLLSNGTLYSWIMPQWEDMMSEAI